MYIIPTSTKQTEQDKMSSYNKKIKLAIKQHQELLNKELSYSEDLQNKETIARHRANIVKVEGMFK
jgi:hypothetical protein